MDIKRGHIKGLCVSKSCFPSLESEDTLFLKLFIKEDETLSNKFVFLMIGEKSILVPLYKGKGDPFMCGSYRAIKLLEQPMKVLESVGKEDQMSCVN